MSSEEPKRNWSGDLSAMGDTPKEHVPIKSVRYSQIGFPTVHRDSDLLSFNHLYLHFKPFTVPTRIPTPLYVFLWSYSATTPRPQYPSIFVLVKFWVLCWHRFWEVSAIWKWFTLWWHYKPWNRQVASFDLLMVLSFSTAETAVKLVPLFPLPTHTELIIAPSLFHLNK